MNGPFTTITVDEYNKLRDAITDLRKRIQSCRQLLERVVNETSISDDTGILVKSALNLMKQSDP